MYAGCPKDGMAAPIRRIVREHGNEITTVAVHCNICGNEFDAPVESLYLR